MPGDCWTNKGVINTVTNKQLEVINRQTRVQRALLADGCIYAIAANENMSAKAVWNYAKIWGIPHCNHVTNLLPACVAYRKAKKLNKADAERIKQLSELTFDRET